MRIGSALLGWLLLSTAPAAADWLVYQRGGIQETRGGWQVEGGQVRFHGPAGTYLSVRADEVDLAASAFLSWQVGDRRAIRAERPPAGAELGAPSAAAAPNVAGPCAAARLAAVLSAETLEVEAGGRRETVHVAGVDAPEPGNPRAELAWLGQETLTAVELLVQPGASLCLEENAPPLLDRAGHRVVYVRLPNGRDLGEELLTRGLALARSGGAARRERYTGLERFALAHGVGHWGEVGHDLALAVVANATEIGGGPAAPPRRAAGRRS